MDIVEALPLVSAISKLKKARYESCSWRKQLLTWSSTSPPACMKA